MYDAVYSIADGVRHIYSDPLILDMIVFCHSKKLMIPGTEDMKAEYRNPTHHIIGALKGCVISVVAAFLAASFVAVIGLFG